MDWSRARLLAGAGESVTRGDRRRRELGGSEHVAAARRPRQ